MTVTQKRLKEVLHYNPETGVFRWAETTSNKSQKGNVAGCLCKHHGYIFIRIDDVLYRAHRLAWLYVHGAFPPDDIDHVRGRRIFRTCARVQAHNGQRADNRWANIRAASGLRGAYSHRSGRWRSSISVEGVETKLGWYATAQQAHEAYLKAKAVMHPYRPIA